MDLDRLEQEINTIVLARGKKLYAEGAVSSLCVEHGECTAQVQGTKPYTVKTRLTKTGAVAKAACNCPFIGREHCKHEVAVFLALNEIQNRPDFEDWESFCTEEKETPA